MVGYRFENSHFVVSSVIPAADIDNIDTLANLIRQTQKLQAFNRYSASDLTILGTLESFTSAKQSQSKRADILLEKKYSKIWLSIQKR